MRRTYMDYMRNDDSGACPDCDCTTGHWMPATATEPEDWSCDSCNGIEDMFDTEYDNQKDRKAEQS